MTKIEVADEDLTVMDEYFPQTLIDKDLEYPEVETGIEEKPKKRRGRPPRAKVEEQPQEEEKPKKKPGRKKKIAVEDPEELTTVQEILDDNLKEEEEKPAEKKKAGKIDNLDPEIFDKIYKMYSVKPMSEIIKETGLTDKMIVKVIKKMEELYSLEISAGGLSQEDFDQYIKPFLTPYNENGPSNFEKFVKKTIDKFKK